MTALDFDSGPDYYYYLSFALSILSAARAFLARFSFRAVRSVVQSCLLMQLRDIPLLMFRFLDILGPSGWVIGVGVFIFG